MTLCKTLVNLSKMQNDKTFNSTYEQLWPELNSGSKVHNHITNTRYESRNPCMQLSKSGSGGVQQCHDFNLTAEFDQSLSRNQNYHSDLTLLNASSSGKSNIFSQPLLLGHTASRLSYTGNFPSLTNQVTEINQSNDVFTQHVGEVWNQEHFLDKRQVLPTNSSVSKGSQAFKTDAVSFQNIQLYNSQRIRNHPTQNIGLNTNNVGVQAKKTEFSLEQAAENFPELNSYKRQKNNKISNVKEFNDLKSQDIPFNKRAGKSWKPKVKDPIFIHLDQALQALPEKSKSESKKPSTPAAQQARLPANILDSDKPQQKKGKVRPDKPKKPSKLKERILAIRNEKHNSNPEGSETQTAPLDELDDSIKRLSLKPAAEENGNVNETDKTATEKCEVETNLSNEGKSIALENKAKEETCQSVNIHSRKFREYCTNCITEELVSSVCALLEKVAQFQDRLFVQNPLKASAKRRYVAGIHQTNKFLNVKKVKVLIIAPDLERSPGEGGLDEKISNMVREAESQEVMCVFGPNRKRLGRTVRKSALVACIAVLSYEGAEEQFSKVAESLNAARAMYQSLLHPHLNSPLRLQDEKPKEIKSQTVPEDSQREDVTSALLAKLRHNISPAAQFLRAINPRDWCGD